MSSPEEAESNKLVESCTGLRNELLKCLRESDCVAKYGLTPRECLVDSSPGYDNSCRSLRIAFFECKRSLLDNRTRFRGRKGY